MNPYGTKEFLIGLKELIVGRIVYLRWVLKNTHGVVRREALRVIPKLIISDIWNTLVAIWILR